MKKRLEKEKKKEFENKLNSALSKLESFDTVENGLSEMQEIYSQFHTKNHINEILTRFKNLFSKNIFKKKIHTQL